ncbi:MAG: SDR family oxidoreductase [Candidatus Delongbacteria bacterium]|nr:SDR family oxidoreductase [Candidatus Delongbacteria bacterium]
MSRPRLLITGLSGFLGGKLVALKPPDFELHGTCYRHPVYPDGCTTHHLDLTGPDLEPLLQELQPEIIIHTAACSSPATVESDPTSALPINLEVTRHLAQWCLEKKCRLVFTSSDQVYDGSHAAWRETDPTRPVNSYGKQKLAGEQLIQQLLPESSLILRVSLLLGPPAYGGSSFSEWILERLTRGENVPLYTNQVRSALGGGTLARGILQAVRHGLSGLFNAGGSQDVDRLEIGQTLAAVTAMSYSYLQAALFSPAKSPGGAAPLDISMNSDRFWQIVGDCRGSLREELTREYR